LATKELSDLTPRQRQVWEMTHGLGEFDKPKSASEIAQALGITSNSVYVTRRRVKKLLGLDEGEFASPKRIIRHESNGLTSAERSLQAQLDGYEREESELKDRLGQIKREKPEVEKALGLLRGLSEKAEEREVVAA
jgi:DNA-binding CsgD family transcriptional regulator